MKFKEIITNTDFSDITKHDSPQVSHKMFTEKFNTAYELSFPIKRFKFNKNIIKFSHGQQMALSNQQEQKVNYS